MATTDIRLKRIEKEYQSVRDGQDQIDTYEEALLGLNETVAANHESNQRQFAEIRVSAKREVGQRSWRI